MASENGEVFIKNLAQFVRTHERALANALQTRNRVARNGNSSPIAPSTPPQTPTQNTTNHFLASSAFATALSLGSFGLAQHNVKPAKLTLTPHHLFYLLSRFEELGVDTGPMSVRVENIHSEQSPANYVSFLSQPPKSRGRSDRDSIHSVSSVRSVMSNMSSFWSNLGVGSSNSTAKSERAKIQLLADLKYLYSAFTKIPCLRLSPDRRARSIQGYEEFPFDTAVPLLVFKNVGALEICDLDFRQFFGWDRVSEQVRSLSVKRGHLDDVTDLIINIVLDDMEKRRRRSSKPQSPPTPVWPMSPSIRHSEPVRFGSTPGTPDGLFPGSSSSPRNGLPVRTDFEISQKRGAREKSVSPTRPTSARHGTSYRQQRGSEKIKRSTSGSSHSSTHSLRGTSRNRSSSNLLSLGILPGSKWRFLKHLSLSDNALSSLSAPALSPLVNTLQSLDLSANLFTEVPECLAALTALRALNLSSCMIDSLHSLSRNPMPAISALNLRSNRLVTIAGIERLLSLERLDVRENKIPDPTEMARLTGIPDIREIWVAGNPFVRPNNNYRITIFNLFRAIPGYSEDISIDSHAPGYSERRHLRERVAESARIPLVQAAERNLEVTMPSKRVPRRRIVDLTLEDRVNSAFETADDAGTSLDTPTSLRQGQDRILAIRRESKDDSNPRPTSEDHYSSALGLDSVMNNKMRTPQLPPGANNPILEQSVIDPAQAKGMLEECSPRDERNNHRVSVPTDSISGDGWLRTLHDEGWAKDSRNQQQPRSILSSRPVYKISNMPTSSQGAVSTGRTIG